MELKIINIEKSESETYIKYQYTAEEENGQKSYLTLFIGDKDTAETKAIKESWVQDFKEGDICDFEFVTKGKYKTISAMKQGGELEKTNEKYKVTQAMPEKPRINPTEERICHGMALNNSTLLVANIFDSKDYADKLIKSKKEVVTLIYEIAEEIYNEGKKRNWF